MTTKLAGWSEEVGVTPACPPPRLALLWNFRRETSGLV